MEFKVSSPLWRRPPREAPHLDVTNYATQSARIDVRTAVGHHTPRGIIELAAGTLRPLAACPDEWVDIQLLGDTEATVDVSVFLFREYVVWRIHAQWRCANCRMAFMAHADGHCLYEPTRYKSWGTSSSWETSRPDAFNLTYGKWVQVPTLDSLWSVLHREDTWRE